MDSFESFGMCVWDVAGVKIQFVVLQFVEFIAQ